MFATFGMIGKILGRGVCLMHPCPEASGTVAGLRPGSAIICSAVPVRLALVWKRLPASQLYGEYELVRLLYLL
jgi:hypothetical protein